MGQEIEVIILSKKIASFANIVALCVFVLPTFSARQKVKNAANSAQSTSTKSVDSYVKLAEDYLNSVTTMSADFVQIDQRGEISEGRLLIRRPDCLKMDYRAPNTHLIVLKNNRITHYDRELKEKSESSAYSSPLSFLVNNRVSLREHIDVLGVLDRDGYVFLTIAKKDDDENGALTLVFSKDPFVLEKWFIFKNKKQLIPTLSTQVLLLNRKFGEVIPYDEFEKIS
jgi:outer membrane lipoprotein-sorting protein